MNSYPKIMQSKLLKIRRLLQKSPDSLELVYILFANKTRLERQGSQVVKCWELI